MIKKFTCLLLLLVSSFAGMNMNLLADEPDNNKTTLTQVQNANNKKRIPSRTIIECEAINGVLVFNANFDYEYMDVEVSGPESILDVLTPTQPFIEAPTLPGTYTLRCTTDGGTVYEGTITL